MGAMDLVETPSITFEEIANDGSDLTNPAADHRRLFLGEDGLLHLIDSAGAVTTPTGGYAPGGTDVAVADGGTGASSASAARTNLGLVIGTDVQAFDADIPTVAASQAEMEAGTEAALRSMSPLRVSQAIAALGGGGGGSAEHTAYEDLAAMLEPLALEPARKSSGSGAFVASSATKKLVIAMWNCQLWNAAWHGQAAGSVGRIDVREPRGPFPITNAGIYAIAADATVSLLDTSLPDYAGAARDVYFDRLAAIRNADTKYWSYQTASALLPLLPGPYGSIITGIFTNDTTWVGIVPPWGTATLLPIHDEIGDSAGDGERHGFGTLIPVSRSMMMGLFTGIADGATTIAAGITFFNCPANWSAVPDTNTYIDRAEFLENALDTGTDYTRSQSTTDFVEIMSPGAFCQVKGNGSWGANGFYRQASWNLVDGRVIEWDVFVPTGGDNCIVGASDGSGQSYADFHCGVDFSGNTLFIFENANGTSRGTVGSGYSTNKLYRVRITLHAGGSATYEIQGGTEYDPIGGATWDDITPGTSSFGTTDFHLAASGNGGQPFLVADGKVYDP